jgi:hypothetical protein
VRRCVVQPKVGEAGEGLHGQAQKLFGGVSWAMQIRCTDGHL